MGRADQLRDGFFLIEEEYLEYDRHDTPAGEITLPVRSRRPVDPGFVLSWTEYQANEVIGRRRGMVLARAPLAKTVWVLPDEPHPGEGVGVVVGNLTADNAAEAVRYVGGPGDYLSTAGWQAPRTLPRAVLRTDLMVGTDGATWPVTLLHTRPDCPEPRPMRRDRIRRGAATPLPRCYVYRGHLHVASVRPMRPDPAGGYVPACGACLRPGPPP